MVRGSSGGFCPQYSNRYRRDIDIIEARHDEVCLGRLKQGFIVKPRDTKAGQSPSACGLDTGWSILDHQTLRWGRLQCFCG
jgi:hypothetical protein